MAVLHEAQAQPVATAGRAVEQAALEQHRARPMSRALRHPDAPGQGTQIELGDERQRVDDVERDGDRLQGGTDVVHVASAARTTSASALWMRPLVASTFASPGPRFGGPPSRSSTTPPASAIIS